MSGLGRNLHIHPAAAVVGVFDQEIDGWRGVMQSYLVDALAGRGILLEATFPPPSFGYGEAWTFRARSESPSWPGCRTWPFWAFSFPTPRAGVCTAWGRGGRLS